MCYDCKTYLNTENNYKISPAEQVRIKQKDRLEIMTELDLKDGKIFFK